MAFSNQVTALANQKLGDRYLFGGTVTNRAPFLVRPDATGQLRITYQGNDHSAAKSDRA